MKSIVDGSAFSLLVFSLLTKGARAQIDLPEEVIDLADLEFVAGVERNNGSPGSFQVQDYLIDQLEEIGAIGLSPDTNTTRDAFKQDCGTSCTNIIGLIQGTDISDEYIMLSAHYDHFAVCSSASGADTTDCNGATDNAAGVTIALGVARFIAALPSGPKRSIVLAFWDKEEDLLFGSEYYTQFPLLPLDQTNVVVNWDIQGSNLSPSTRNITFAIGAESGGRRLTSAISDAVDGLDLDMKYVSLALGQGRSDHQNFANAGVPTVFFSDSTNGCYHTVGDEIKNVDLAKLEQQAKIGLKLVYDLAFTVRLKPRYRQRLLPARPSDAVALNDVVNLAVNDLELFPSRVQDLLLTIQEDLNRISDGGWLVFLVSIATFASAAGGLVEAFTFTECDGYVLTDEM